MSRPAQPSPTPLERPHFVPQRIDRARRGRGVTGFVLLTVVACAGWSLVSSDRQVRSASDTPIAFWSWRGELPGQEVVDRAEASTGARMLFVRAGTIDAASSGATRIRAVTGAFPRGIDVHFVYNATPEMLEVFETTDTDTVADAVLAAYEMDSGRAKCDGASIGGLQLDLDVPTRLLPRYGKLLRTVDERLPGDMDLSVTGLPTWMSSADLAAALEPVDFWIPQFYGGTVPRDVRDATPIAAVDAVRAGVRRASLLGKPFLAGLAAYGYTLQFNADGSLRALHGRVDPARVARSYDVEVAVDGVSPGSVSNRRVTYRVLTASVIAGMRVAPGDFLVVETPSCAVLRASASAAREEGGDALIGICVFRLPEGSDRSVLRMASISAALADRDPVEEVEVSVDGGEPGRVRRVAVTEVKP